MYDGIQVLKTQKNGKCQSCISNQNSHFASMCMHRKQELSIFLLKLLQWEKVLQQMSEIKYSTNPSSLANHKLDLQVY